MDKVKIHDKTFEISIHEDEIQNRVKELALQMDKELKGKDVIFLSILNGAFMFAADLFKNLTIPAPISFLKIASYAGTASSGTVKRLIGINEDISNKTVVIIEDIVDTGITLEQIIKQLKGYEPKEMKIATFLHKPESYQKDMSLDYVGFNISPEFIVGYGLDYNGLGRNLKHLYKLC